MSRPLQVADEQPSAEEAAVIRDFMAFLRSASEKRHPSGTMRRFNQPRHAGCVEGEFTIPDTLPEELRVGLFARPGTYPAFVRFANASSSTSATDRDADIRGMSIQVRGIGEGNLTPGSTTQDFVLNSHPVMVAPGAKQFLELLRATEAGGIRAVWYFLTHLRAVRIGLAARSHPTCHLDIPYWSTTPYLFGDRRAVKYKTRPTSPAKSSPPEKRTDGYLRDAMKRHLASSDATFDFMVQAQTDPQKMPIEDASIEWEEASSPFRTIASLRIPAQDFDTPERMARCEAIAFSPWNCLPEHRPLGGMNRARKAIYAELARFRAERNVGA
jgi:catalase